MYLPSAPRRLSEEGQGTISQRFEYELFYTVNLVASGLLIISVLLWRLEGSVKKGTIEIRNSRHYSHFA